MAITNRFKSHGETGSLPPAGFSWAGGDQVNEKHLDALFYNLNLFEEEVIAQAIVKDGSTAMTDDLDMGGNGITAVGGDIADDVQNVIYNYSAKHVPLSILEATDITATAGDGLKGGGAATLGGSFTLNIEPVDFAGAGLEDDGTDDLRIASAAAGDGLGGGSGSALSVVVADFAGHGLEDSGGDLRLDAAAIGDGLDGGDGVNLSVDVSDFAGAHLADDGSNNMAVQDGAGSGLNADQVDGAEADDLAPKYDDGSVNVRQNFVMRFGSEGSTTTSTDYVTIAASDLAFDPDEYKDDDGNLYIRVKAHLKHEANSGDAFLRMWRQNAASAVTGSEVSVTANDGWGFADSGWIDFGTESGNESYQLQLKSSDGEQVGYNSVLLHFGTPV